MLEVHDVECAFDPALMAAEAALRAEQKLTAMPVRSVIDELTADFATAEAQLEAAEVAFAQTIPTSIMGALIKVRALEDMLRAMPMPDDSLELTHLRTIAEYMERSGSSK